MKASEAVDRALETARKNFERCPDCDKPLEPCGSCPQCGEYPDSPCHKAYLAWDGWNGPAPMWDTFRAGWQARAAESAMNAQERELREALQKIADNYGGCHCHHDTPDCCENPAVGEFCPHCIAEIALANSGAERLLAERGEGV